MCFFIAIINILVTKRFWFLVYFL